MLTTAAIVLAAGASRRLGRSKQLEHVGGRPMVVHALEAAAAAEVVLLMTGCGGRRVAALAGTARVVDVRQWRRGMGHVLACGVRALPRDVGAVVVLLADQPGVTREAVESLLQRWLAGDGPVLTATYDGRAGHPRLFDHTVFGALAELDGEAGARSLPQVRHAIGVPVAGNDHDVDDEESLAAARRARAGSPERVR